MQVWLDSEMGGVLQTPSLASPTYNHHTCIFDIETRANVHQFAIQFSDDLKRAHSEIDEKNATDEEEIARMLENRSSGV